MHDVELHSIGVPVLVMHSMSMHEVGLHSIGVLVLVMRSMGLHRVGVHEVGLHSIGLYSIQQLPLPSGSCRHHAAPAAIMQSFCDLKPLQPLQLA
jgi:hypothetical protein